MATRTTSATSTGVGAYISSNILSLGVLFLIGFIIAFAFRFIKWGV